MRSNEIFPLSTDENHYTANKMVASNNNSNTTTNKNNYIKIIKFNPHVVSVVVVDVVEGVVVVCLVVAVVGEVDL